MDTLKIDVTPIFPTLLLQTRVDGYKKLIDTAYHLQEAECGVQASNMGGWHSSLQEMPEILKKYIPFSDYDSVCWYNINQNLQGNYSHTHPDNHWSGVLWLRVPDPNVKLEFEHPDCFAQSRCVDSMNENIKEMYNYCKAWKVTPDEGLLVMFPSSLRHRVYISHSIPDRVSLSFNLHLNKK